jgi:putative membrane protein
VLVSLLLILLVIFVIAYPLAVIGIAFDVKPSFAMSWAGSALLFLEGTLLIVAAMLVYGWLRALLAALIVIVLSYLIEALGVNTGFPFGTYHYTNLLFPFLPGAFPLAIAFAWILIVFGSYNLVKRSRSAGRGMGGGSALLGALLATLLDLAIEPVAAHVVLYWEWLAPGPANYYGVPLANFVAWFVVALVLLVVVDSVLGNGRQIAVETVCEEKRERVARKDGEMGMAMRMAVLTPPILFGGSLLMFGLIDLTHGYRWAVVFALLAGIIIFLLKDRWAALSIRLCMLDSIK